MTWHDMVTLTMRVNQVHRGRDESLQKEKRKDFSENWLVIQVAKPHWLQISQLKASYDLCQELFVYDALP